jgi:hypothetical protein
MKKLIITLCFICFSSFAFSQNKNIVVVDSLNKIPIQFVKIINIETNEVYVSKINGKFSIDNKISNNNYYTDCNGYENKKFEIKNLSDTLFLKKSEIRLRDVKYTNNKNESIELGNHRDKAKTSKINFEYKKNNIYAVFIKNTENTIDYIKKIIFKLKKSNSNIVYIRPYVFSVDKFNNPFQEITNNNIVFEVKNNTNIVEIDVSDFNIEFSENGIFLGFELINDSKSIKIGIGKSKERNSFILYNKNNKTIAVPLKIGGDEIFNWQFGIKI